MIRAALFLLLLVPLATSAAPRFARASGAWNAAIWSATSCAAGALSASVPGAADDATICAGVTVTLDSSRTADGVVVENTGTLNLSTFTLTIDNTPAITFNNGATISGTGSLLLNCNCATTVVTGTSVTATLPNLILRPTMSANRTYTLAAGTIDAINVTGNLTIDPPTASAGTVRAMTVNMGTLTTAAGGLAVGGVLTLDAGGNETVTFNTGGIVMNFGRMVQGGTGTGNQTFNAGASTVTLDGGTGPLMTRNTNGVFTDGTSTVVMNSSASVTLTSGTFTGANTFNNLTVDMASQTGTLGAAIAVANNLTLTAGTLADGGNQITGNATGTLSATANGSLTLGSAGTATTFPTAFTGANIALNAASTVTYAAGVAQAVATTSGTAITYGHLTFSGAGTKTPAAGTLTVAGNWNASSTTALNTNNNVVSLTGTLSGTGSVTQGAGLMTVGGDWTNTGTFTASSAGVTLTGSARQITGPAGGVSFTTLTVNGTYTNNNTGTGVSATTALSGTGTLTQGANGVLRLGGSSGIATLTATASPNTVHFIGGALQTVKATTYHHLTVNNASGVELGGDATVNGTLTFTAGDLSTLSANTLIIASTGSVAGAAAARHVVGNVRRAFAASTTFTFPVGDGTNYAPVDVVFGAAVTGNLTATVNVPDHPNSTAGVNGVLGSTGVNRYWTLKDSSVAGTATLTFTYVAGDNDGGTTPGSYLILRGANCSGTTTTRTCTPWRSQAVSGTPTTTSAVASGVAVSADSPAQADFAIGNADPSTNLQREKQFIYTRELY